MSEPQTQDPTPWLTIARSKLGQREDAVQNTGAIVAWSIKPWTRQKPGPKMKWCGGFACTCMVLGGVRDALKFGSLTVTTIWERMAPYRLPAGAVPQPGDVVFFEHADSDTGIVGHHIGFVEVVNVLATGSESKYWFTTIEGNTRNMVAGNRYTDDDKRIMGFARPVLVGS
jgi:hypothetical protein